MDLVPSATVVTGVFVGVVLVGLAFRFAGDIPGISESRKGFQGLL